MTPAVTAIALIRFASVERPISARIGHATEEEARTARHMLNGVDERPIDSYFDRLRRFHNGSHLTHHDRRCCRRFGAFFIHGNERLVEDVRDGEVVVWFARRNFVEIGATRWLIE